jgi:NADPH2:quinone reductase
MKAVIVFQHGTPDVLTLSEIPIPEPKADEVLVENRFIGVNFVDTQHRAGLYYPVALPLIPGIEAAGVVIEVGREVNDFRVGDRVAYAGYMGGLYAEYTSVPQDRLVPVPPDVSLEQAAACLMTGLTAAILTQSAYAVQQGDFVLIHAAAGGVGSFLIQMAKRAGAVVIGVTSSETKASLATGLGADHTVVYAPGAFEREILSLTHNQGVHVIYDGVGGDRLEANLNVLRARGHLVEFGQAGGRPLPLDITRLSGITGTGNRGSLTITWASAGDYLMETAQLRAYARSLFGAVAAGELRILLAKKYPLQAAAEAHRALESRTVSGKLLLTPV